MLEQVFRGMLEKSIRILMDYFYIPFAYSSFWTMSQNDSIEKINRPRWKGSSSIVKERASVILNYTSILNAIILINNGRLVSPTRTFSPIRCRLTSAHERLNRGKRRKRFSSASSILVVCTPVSDYLARYRAAPPWRRCT